MKSNRLIKVNLYITFILLVGFTLTAIFAYRANYRASLDSMEQVSSLTAEGIYYQITGMFTKPVNISLAMSHDSLLVTHLGKEAEHLEDASYTEQTKEYLGAYQKKYDFDSVFLVSEATKRYYNFNGIDRVLKEGDPENIWYYKLLEADAEYQVVVDNDEVEGAENEITVFVNCKIYDEAGRVLGAVGVGIRIDQMKELLAEYEEKYDLEVCLVGEDGEIEISTAYTGYEKKDWFDVYGHDSMREKLLSWEEDTGNLELWTEGGRLSGKKNYVVTRYIPDLSWHLIVEQNTGQVLREIEIQICRSFAVLAVVILSVIIIVTQVIRKFNRQIASLVEERQENFNRATEEMYDNIYEFNITKNCTIGKRTMEYFASLGAEKLPYDEALKVIAEKRIKDEFRAGYINTFRTENVLREYEAGNCHLQYDFMTTENGADYFWMRIDTYIFYCAEDKAIHMFSYRKNIEDQKQKERLACRDEMTDIYNKKTTERAVSLVLKERGSEMYAFFIFDIDNFKQVNDRFGHAFGDFCIQSFAAVLREYFGEDEITGRIGGDEFAAFIRVENREAAINKAKELSAALSRVCTNGELTCQISASIGVALAPLHGEDFETIYKNADAALYRVKKNGKNGYAVY